MSEYSTDEIVDFLERCNYATYSDYYVAAIARLRNADRLCEAVSSLSEGYWGFANLHFVARLKQAIADYKGKA